MIERRPLNLQFLKSFAGIEKINLQNSLKDSTFSQTVLPLGDCTNTARHGCRGLYYCFVHKQHFCCCTIVKHFPSSSDSIFLKESEDIWQQNFWMFEIWKLRVRLRSRSWCWLQCAIIHIWFPSCSHFLGKIYLKLSQVWGTDAFVFLSLLLKSFAWQCCYSFSDTVFQFWQLLEMFYYILSPCYFKIDKTKYCMKFPWFGILSPLLFFTNFH